MDVLGAAAVILPFHPELADGAGSHRAQLKQT